MDLRPPEIIQKILISSTSRFTGEYQAENILITHVWPDFRRAGISARLNEGPLSRSAYMISFVTQPALKVAGAPVPEYSYLGEQICALLSLLYGKRFDSHGCVQSLGLFSLPHLGEFNDPCISQLPQNNQKERSDFAVPLMLGQAGRLLEPTLSVQNNSPHAIALNAAAKFYLQALQNAEKDAEIAYLHLITAGEILANVHHPQSDDLIDDDIKNILDDVSKYLPSGERSFRILASRMRQIKRRFRLTVEDLIDDQFFSQSSTDPRALTLQAHDLAARISAAYDLRSRYVHTGMAFGRWVSPAGALSEIQIGQPVIGDNEIVELLYKAPRYLGLERLIRYCLLRFAERNQLLKSA